MSFKSLFLLFFLTYCVLTTASGQVIADFDFEDPANPLKNVANPDPAAQAVSINPQARLKDGGVYTEHDPDIHGHQNINLVVPLGALQNPHSGSIYIEVDFMNNEKGAWLFVGGESSHTGIYHDSTGGFRVRYYTISPNPNNFVDSHFIGSPLEQGSVGKISFHYDEEKGIAYLYLDGNEIWRSTESQDTDGNSYAPTPGAPFYWHTEAGFLTVGANMNGNSHYPGQGSIPSLYRFLVSADPCIDPVAPVENSVENSRCGPGKLTLSATGAADGSFRWYENDDDPDPIPGEINSSFTTPELSNTTTYYVTIVDGFCESEKVAVSAVIRPRPDAPQASGNEHCGPASLALQASGGRAGQYRWYRNETDSSPIPGESGSTFTTEILSSSRQYFVAIQDENGCESPRTKVEAVINEMPEAPLPLSLSECGSGSYEITASLPGNSENPLSFKWYKQEDDLAPELEEDRGTISVNISSDTVLYVSSSNGTCESNKVPIEFKIHELPSVDAGEDVTIFRGESIQLEAKGSNGEIINCSWEPVESLDRTDVYNPTASPTVSTAYVVKREDAITGCAGRDTIVVYVSNDFPIPNAFSPNNDGRNDQWEIPNIENYPDCTIKIYNSWGNEVFTSKGYQEPWDGRFNGQLLPAGTYYYVLQLSIEHEVIKGTLFIVR